MITRRFASLVMMSATLPHQRGGSVLMTRYKGTVMAMANLTSALEAFKTDNGRYPMTAENLNALVAGPAELGSKWHGPYIPEMPLDAWGRPFIYRFPDKSSPTEFELMSTGEDGMEGTNDDIDRTTMP